jgi:hypothetical protein
MLDAKKRLVEMERDELNKTFKENEVPFILISRSRISHTSTGFSGGVQ